MTRQLIIADRVIGDDSAPYVIAEIGHNHQGNLKTANSKGLADHDGKKVTAKGTVATADDGTMTLTVALFLLHLS